MKVDKAVCTTDAMANIESSRRYETLLSTLVQNKILAIKRDCELKQREKEQRKQNQNFLATIFGKQRNHIDKNDNNSCTDAVNDGVNVKINITDKLTTSQEPNTIEVDKYYLNANTADIDTSQTQISDFKYSKNNGILCITTIANTMDNQSVISAPCGNLKSAREANNLSFKHEQYEHEREQKHDQSVKTPLTVAIQNDVQNINEIDNKIASSESLNDTKPISGDKTTVVSVEMNADYGTQATIGTTNSKSSSIVSQIDGYNESMNLKSNLKIKKNRTDFIDTCKSDTISAPNLTKHKTALNPSTTNETAYDHEQWHRLHILEAKSISAQCSPIFSQRQICNSDSTTTQTNRGMVHRTSIQLNGADIENNNNRLQSTKKNLDKDESGSESIEQRHKTNGTSTNKTKRVNSLTFFKRNDKVSKCCDANNAHGFISSFNQLTSNTLPVIASTKPTTIQLTATNNNNIDNNADDNRINSGAFFNDERKISNLHRDIRHKKDIRHKHEKSKYKRTHRCSEPILAYASPNRLQHCILTMPPNQSIQLHYNDELTYDVSLKMETDNDNEFTSGHRRHRYHKHHKHRHGRRKRHKRKILVHDLDKQIVKVIDPEDMSQRARWTIIATACLLLLMCLLLVGITLRMAPLIDDLVRQENERIQETINRGKYIRNFTHAAFIGGQQQHHHP